MSPIPIIRPVLPAAPAKPPLPDERKLCRNILIYGQCRFQHKGCLYLHHPVLDGTTAPFVPAPPPMAVGAQEFVPRDAPEPPLEYADEYYDDALHPVRLPLGGTPLISQNGSLDYAQYDYVGEDPQAAYYAAEPPFTRQPVRPPHTGRR